MFLHSDPVQKVGGRHRPLVMRDEEELSACSHFLQKGGEAFGIRVVEGGVDFVQ